MSRAIRILIATLLGLQIAYLAISFGGFSFTGLNYLEPQVVALLWLYSMLLLTVVLLFLLVLNKVR